MIPLRNPSPLFIACAKVFEFYPQYGCLHFVKPSIISEHCVLVFGSVTMITVQPDFSGNLSAVRGNHTAFAVPAQIFGEVETEASCIAYSPGLFTSVGGAMRLT